MATCLLQETGGSLRVSEGGKWSATLLTPGKGASGTYAEEMLEEYGPRAFQEGMKLWFGHPKEGQGPGDRDPRDQWGVLESNAEYVVGEGLVGIVRVLPHWKEVVDSLGDQASLSIYAMGESDKEGNITALVEHLTNSVDIVSYPGRLGSGLKQKLEAARAASEEPRVTSAQEKEKNVEEKLDKLIALFETFVTKQDAVAEAAAKAEADAEAAAQERADAIEAYAAAEKAISEADLLPSQKDEIRAEAKLGKDFAPLIEKAKKVMDEARKVVNESQGSSYILGERADSDDFTVAGFGGFR